MSTDRPFYYKGIKIVVIWKFEVYFQIVVYTDLWISFLLKSKIKTK